MTNFSKAKQSVIDMKGSFTKANSTMKRVIENTTESQAEDYFERYMDEITQKYDRKESQWDELEKQTEITENGFFLPLPTEYSSVSDYRKDFFNSWIDGTKNNLSDYQG